MSLVLRENLGFAIGITTSLSLTVLPVLSKNLDTEIVAVKGEVGIAVIDIASKKQFMLNQKKQFPMQSVCKLPLSVAVLLLADQGKLSVQDKVTVRRIDLLPYSPIKDAIKGDKSDFTIRELMTRTITDSDNTACDLLIAKAGGAQAVTDVLKKAGITGVRIDRPERQLQKDSKNIKKFLADPRDTATPEAMVALLLKIYEGKLLSKESTAMAVADLFNCKTGPNRLRAGLPKDWRLGHKTGTGGDVAGFNAGTNDVGIIVGPKGQLIYVAVFVKGSRSGIEKREALMARVAAKAIDKTLW